MLRSVALISGVGLLLSSCSANVAQPTHSQRLHREAAACDRIGTPPKLPTSSPDSFFATSVKTSLILALAKSDDISLEDVAQDLRSAALNSNGQGMVRALDEGVATCHRLGLSTTR
jgi:hypothetical protein